MKHPVTRIPPSISMDERDSAAFAPLDQAAPVAATPLRNTKSEVRTPVPRYEVRRAKSEVRTPTREEVGKAKSDPSMDATAIRW
jgi:hypothetical protein